MTELECDRCGTVFDTTRAPAVVGQDRSRCPSCGHRHGGETDADTADGDRDETATGAGDEDDEVHIHIHK